MTKKPLLLIVFIAATSMSIGVFIGIRLAPNPLAPNPQPGPQPPLPAPATVSVATPDPATDAIYRLPVTSGPVVPTKEMGRYTTYADCQNILQRGMPAYGSQDYDTLRYAVRFMLENNNDQAYMILNSLPPGELSAYMVNSIFGGRIYTKYAEIFAAADRITSPDINRAAMEGLIGSMIGESMAKFRPADKPTQSDLDRIRAAGLSKDTEIALLVELCENSAITNEQIAEFIDSKDEYAVRTAAAHLPLGPAKYILEKCLREGGKVDKHPIRTVAYQAAQVNPREALDWSYRLPEKEGLIAFSSSFQEWVIADPNSASKHLGALNSSPQKNAGIEILVETAISDKDLATARRWVELVSDPAKKAALASMIDGK